MIYRSAKHNVEIWSAFCRAAVDDEDSPVKSIALDCMATAMMVSINSTADANTAHPPSHYF